MSVLVVSKISAHGYWDQKSEGRTTHIHTVFFISFSTDPSLPAYASAPLARGMNTPGLAALFICPSREDGLLDFNYDINDGDFGLPSCQGYAALL